MVSLRQWYTLKFNKERVWATAILDSVTDIEKTEGRA
jgi:hypothetical protein